MHCEELSYQDHLAILCFDIDKMPCNANTCIKAAVVFAAPVLSVVDLVDVPALAVVVVLLVAILVAIVIAFDVVGGVFNYNGIKGVTSRFKF